VSREVGVEVYRLEQWREKALLGMDLARKNRTGEPFQEELDAAKRYIGELSMECMLFCTGHVICSALSARGGRGSEPGSIVLDRPGWSHGCFDKRIGCRYHCRHQLRAQ